MSAQKLEVFLTKLYVDDHARLRFLAAPRSEALNAGLNEEVGGLVPMEVNLKTDCVSQAGPLGLAHI